MNQRPVVCVSVVLMETRQPSQGSAQLVTRKLTTDAQPDYFPRWQKDEDVLNISSEQMCVRKKLLETTENETGNKLAGTVSPIATG